MNLSVITPGFVALVFLGSIAGLFVGSIPGLSVSMATALLVSITYTWQTNDALAMIMGVYVVGVFSGAVSAILINIPGAPSSVVTTLDGYPLAKRGEAYKALFYATIYSFIGSVVGLVALWLLAKPVTALATRFTSKDYFLLSLFGLVTVASVTAKDYRKGIIAAALGVMLSLVGLEPVNGLPRLTLGIPELNNGINIVPALVGLFGFAEVLSVVFAGPRQQTIQSMKEQKIPLKQVLKHLPLSLYTSTIGTLVGALPGAGGPVAAFLAYNETRRIVKKPSAPFGEGTVEGIVASESSNNACIGGALIPMLTLGVPGDAVTAIIMSVFVIHGLQPGPTFLTKCADSFGAILVAGFIACLAVLLLGLLVAPKLSKVIAVPKNVLLPVVTVLCVVGAYACNTRLFDVVLMFIFGLLGFVLRRRGYPAAPLVLGLVLGKDLDVNLGKTLKYIKPKRGMTSLERFCDSPITIILAILTLLVILGSIPPVKRFAARCRVWLFAQVKKLLPGRKAA